MKKVLSILAALVLLMTMVCGVSLAEDMEGERIVLGIWDLVEYCDAEGNVIEGEIPNITVIIYNDGTGTIELNGEAFDAVIEEPDFGDAIVLNVLGDYQDFVLDSETNYLKQENPEDGSIAYFAPRVDLPAELNAESIDEFQGVWTITGYYANNLYIDLKGETPETLTVIFGTATPTVVIDGNNVNILNGQLIGIATFEDGALKVVGDNGTALIELVEEGIALSADDTIRYYAEK